MKIINIDINKEYLLKENNKINLCLGFFDGLHLGHLELINTALKAGETAVMTFDVLPNFNSKNNINSDILTSLDDKKNLLEDIGVKYLYILKMSKELLNLSKNQFIEKILKKINPQSIFVGEDYRFGYEAKGTPDYLKKYFDVHIVPLKQKNNRKISSRYIKELINEGKMDEIPNYLGRNYSINGKVIRGFANGRKIDFPTANIELNSPYVIPKIGVYMGCAIFLSMTYKAIISISNHPTIQELNKPIIEVHLINYNGDLYGQNIKVEFVSFMRNIQKFESLDELKNQLIIDRDNAIKALKEK